MKREFLKTLLLAYIKGSATFLFYISIGGFIAAFFEGKNCFVGGAIFYVAHMVIVAIYEALVIKFKGDKL